MEQHVRRIGIVGGTGDMGRGIAARLAALGHAVVLGSRDAGRAVEAADEVRDAWPDRRLDVTGAANEAVVDADLVVMAAPWQGVLAVGAAHADALAGRTVVSVANALVRAGGAFLPLTMPRGSVAAELQAVAPGARVVGALHHLPAGPLADLDHELACDVLVCGEHVPARAEVAALVDAVPGLRAVDAGGLAAAGAIEAMTAVLVGVNVGYRTHSTLRLGGSLDRPSVAFAALGED